MKIIVENELVFDNVSALIPEAQVHYDSISHVFEYDEIVKIVENLSANSPEFAVALGSIVESLPLNEFIVKHVDSKGQITKTKDRKTRQRLAYQTTGLSKSERRRIARKASKTKRANPSTQIRAKRKTKKALQKRKMYGLDK